jgi:hypothetical protein
MVLKEFRVGHSEQEKKTGTWRGFVSTAAERSFRIGYF